VEGLHADNLKIVIILTCGFTLASILGYLSQRLHLSPLLGYLAAGYIIGPYSPGFVADLEISEQLAEIGVVLMMFGVGLHFKWTDLVNVKNIAIPGAFFQTLSAALFCMLLVYVLGGALQMGLIMGLAIGVASTVVLVRVLTDNNLLDNREGHIAVGWLIVEDILTVAILILLPTLGLIFRGADFSFSYMIFIVGLIIFKFFILAAVMFTLGRRLVTFMLINAARVRSHELFTLTVLAFIFAIATGSTLIFGTSVALGAFIAGMVIGQTDVSHQASSNALPMKDTFVVVFFLSVGMLFNPAAITENFGMFIGVLSIVLFIKPLTAMLIMLVYRYTLYQALVVAMALAQIGEFSFILAEEALKLHILPDESYDIIVACALFSIAINPLLFKLIDHFKPYLKSKTASIQTTGEAVVRHIPHVDQALVIGFGPVGSSVTHLLESMGVKTAVIDRNVDSIAKMREENRRDAVYGDAALFAILEAANIQDNDLIVITAPEIDITLNIIKAVRHLSSTIDIIARTRYIADRDQITSMGIKCICCEDEAVKAFNQAVIDWKQARA
jgi:CPA2 family monovalent cation:H+ antiporter-2